MKINVSLIEYLGQGEAVVELNTGQQVDIFWSPYDEELLFIEDVTGTIGEWLEKDTSDIPSEAVKLLHQAYRICAEKLAGEGRLNYDKDHSI